MYQTFVVIIVLMVVTAKMAQECTKEKHCRRIMMNAERQNQVEIVGRTDTAVRNPLRIELREEHPCRTDTNIRILTNADENKTETKANTAETRCRKNSRTGNSIVRKKISNNSIVKKMKTHLKS